VRPRVNAAASSTAFLSPPDAISIISSRSSSSSIRSSSSYSLKISRNNSFVNGLGSEDPVTSDRIIPNTSSMILSSVSFLSSSNAIKASFSNFDTREEHTSTGSFPFSLMTATRTRYGITSMATTSVKSIQSSSLSPPARS